MPYEPSDVFESPPENSLIWRYIPFVSLCNLLLTRSLYFRRVVKFRDKDPWEAMHSLANLSVEHFRREYFQGAEVSDEYLVDLLQNNKKLIEQQVKIHAANCWHLSEHESDAFWKIYASQQDGVAIRSTFARLKECVSKCDRRKINIGKVKYGDLTKRILEPGKDLLVLWKRQSFQHETELRAVISEQGSLWASKTPFDSEDGEMVPIDVDVLVDCVLVSPLAIGWMVPTIASVVKQLGYSFPVVQSDHLKPPVYPGDSAT